MRLGMNKYGWTVLTFLLALCCSFLSPALTLANKRVDRIAITYVKFPLNAPLIIARAQGLYEKEFGPDGIRIEWPEVSAGPKQAEALASGAVQFASVISADAVLTAKSKGADHPKQSRALIARETGIDANDVARLLPDYDFDPSATPADLTDLATIQDFLLDWGVITTKVDIKNLFWP